MNFKRPKRAYPSWRGRRGRWDVVIWSGARQGFPLELIFTFNSRHVRVRNGFVHQTAASIFSHNFSNGSQTFLMKHVFRLIFFFTFEFLSQFIADGLKIIKGVLGRSQRDDFVFSIALNFANLTYNNNKGNMKLILNNSTNWHGKFVKLTAIRPWHTVTYIQPLKKIPLKILNTTQIIEKLPLAGIVGFWVSERTSVGPFYGH